MNVKLEGAMYKTVSYTREELFDKVWSMPLLKLAAEIGVSDVALGKTCRRAKIPLPGRGYWLKDAKTRGRPRLPACADPYYETIRFSVLDELVAAALYRPAKREGTGGSDTQGGASAPVIVVPATLEQPHPLVAKTLKAFAKAETFEGRVQLDFKEVLRVRTSPDAFDRALRLFDVLIKESERRACKWKVTDKGETIVVCDGEEMKVELKERLTKREAQRPPEPSRSRGSYYTPTYYPRYEWISTNEFSFQIDEYVEGAARRNWNDGKRAFLEDKLQEIIEGFPMVAAGLKAKHAKWEAQKRERELEEARRKERARHAEALRRLRRRMVNDMMRWERAERLRRYCDALEATAAGKSSNEVSAGAATWLAWAREQANLLDPLQSDLNTITSLNVKVPEWFKGLGEYDKPDADWWTPVAGRDDARSCGVHLPDRGSALPSVEEED